MSSHVGNSPVQHGVPDHQAPDRARLLGVVLVVGQRADRHRGLDQPVGVVEVGQRDRSGAHQRAVAGAAAGALVDVARGLGHRRAGRVAPGAGRARRRSGCRRRRARRRTSRRSPARSRRAPRACAGRRPSAATRRWRRPGRCRRSTRPGAKPPSPPPIIAGTRSGADAGELVAGAEGVAGGGGDEYAAGAVGLGGGQSLESSGHPPADAECQVVAGLRHRARKTSTIASRWAGSEG